MTHVLLFSMFGLSQISSALLTSFFATWFMGRLVYIMLLRNIENTLESSMDEAEILTRRLDEPYILLRLFLLQWWAKRRRDKLIAKSIPSLMLNPVISDSNFSAHNEKTIAQMTEFFKEFSWYGSLEARSLFRNMLLAKFMEYQNTENYACTVQKLAQGYSSEVTPVAYLRDAHAFICLLIYVLGSACPKDLPELQEIARDQYNIACIRDFENDWENTKPKDRKLGTVKAMFGTLLHGGSHYQKVHDYILKKEKVSASSFPFSVGLFTVVPAETASEKNIKQESAKAS